MEPVLATQHLQVIRTLMERSALYRRALAPIMAYAGVVGLVASAVGWKLQIARPAAFIGYWYLVGVIAVMGVLLLVRRQAWQQAEPFWSPPTRRVALATLPPLCAGFLLGAAVLAADLRGVAAELPARPEWLAAIGLPAIWITLYGCALHAAGFYTTRGMRLFGILMVLAGCALMAAGRVTWAQREGHLAMGFFFGVMHLAYGMYLHFTERDQPET